MLAPDEKAWIAQALTSADQDYFVWSGLLGEPFLRQDTLCYYDGETAAVVGQPFRRSGPQAHTSAGLTSVIADWARCDDVHFINYSGPEQVGTLDRDEWNLLYASEPEACNCEVFLDLQAPGQGDFGWGIRGQLRCAARHGLEVNIGRHELLGHEHISLLRELAISHHFIVSGAAYLTNVVSILRDPETVVCEGRVRGKLVGFTVTHEHFPGHPFLIIAAIDRNYRGTSDSLHAALIEYYRGRGAVELGMGYAIDQGLYRYKMKWPGARVLAPCRQSIWQRLGSNHIYNDSLYWPWRLVTDAVRADLALRDPRWYPEYRSVPGGAIRVQVPDIAHLTDSSSGVSALLAVCKYYGAGPADDELFARDLSLDTMWPDPGRLVAAVRKYGLEADPQCPMSLGDLLARLEENKPVVLLLQAWGEEYDESPRCSYREVWDDNHYLVAIGYDEEGVYFEDPSLQGIRGFLSYPELDERWHASGRNREQLHRFGVAVGHGGGGQAAYLTRARRIM
jgi:predicted double-glycine peptidase